MRGGGPGVEVTVGDKVAVAVADGLELATIVGVAAAVAVDVAVADGNDRVVGPVAAGTVAVGPPEPVIWLGDTAQLTKAHITPRASAQRVLVHIVQFWTVMRTR